MSLRTIRTLSNSFRNYSTTSSLVNVTVNEKTGVATATLHRPPVNSLNLELITELRDTFQNLEKNKCKGLILTSSSKSVFCAGLDITELYKPNPDRLRPFWISLQDMWINLYGSSYPTVAVINGHAPAGGCLLALSCEYRIMLNSFTIGLNETRLGMVVLPWFIASMRNVIGNRQTELALPSGHLFQTEEALKIGLIDEIAASKEEGMEKAEKFLGRFAKIPPHARALTKKAIRGADILNLVKSREKEVDQFVALVSSPKLQKLIGAYLEALKQKQK